MTMTRDEINYHVQNGRKLRAQMIRQFFKTLTWEKIRAAWDTTRPVFAAIYKIWIYIKTFGGR